MDPVSFIPAMKRGTQTTDRILVQKQVKGRENPTERLHLRVDPLKFMPRPLNIVKNTEYWV